MKKAVSRILLVVLGVALFVYGFLVSATGIFPASIIESGLRRLSPSGSARPPTLVRKDGGVWGRRRDLTPAIGASDLDDVNALAYVSGRNPAPPVTGVTVFDRSRAFIGYNVFSSAHGPQAFLMDMEGAVLHTWELDRDSVWPELEEADEGRPRRYFRRVRLLPNGDLLAIYEYTGIVRISARSELLWAHQGWNHHDLDIDEDGRVFVLGRDIDEQSRLALDANPDPSAQMFVAGKRVMDENITILAPDGRLIETISIVEAIGNSPYAALLDKASLLRDSREPLELLHSNTVHVLDGTLESLGSAFKKGNILTCLRDLSTVAIIDPEARTVVWALSNIGRYQHDPTMLPGGRMLLFDNLFKRWTRPDEAPEDRATEIVSRFNRSRVIELDLVTQEILWEYSGSDESPLFSSVLGAAQRLPNLNTLIVESDQGRILEVTPGNEVVWEYNNPHTAGPTNDLVAVIPDLDRLPLDSAAVATVLGAR